MDAEDRVRPEAEERNDLNLFELQELPPMLTPKHDLMKSQARKGVIMVTTTIVMLVSITSVTAWAGVAIYPIAFLCMGLIALEAAAAIIALFGVLSTDPGVIERSPKNCYPLPPEIFEFLEDSDQNRPHQCIMVESINRNDMFCVSCLVWRRPDDVDENSFESSFCCPGSRRIRHCTTCQRCVKYHDHHCTVLGRCIGGVGLQGNLKYFNALCFSGVAAVITCFATATTAFALNFGWWAAGAFLIVCVLGAAFCYRSKCLRPAYSVIRLVRRCWILFIRATVHRSQGKTLSSQLPQCKNKRDESQLDNEKSEDSNCTVEDGKNMEEKHDL